MTLRLVRIFRITSRCQSGVRLRDKWLALLLSATVSSHPDRILRHRLLRWLVEKHATSGIAALRVRTNSRTAEIAFRVNNQSDHHIVGRFVVGYYDLPAFVPKTIIDGGANIGTFALHAASFFPNVKLVCYEPDPDNASVLRTNLRRNFISADVREMGLWSENGTAYFKAASSRTGYVEKIRDGNPVNVVVPEFGEDTWFKLDIEGAEYEVLPALLRAGRLPRHITLEIHNFQKKGEALTSLMTERGYTIIGDLDSNADCIRVTATLACRLLS